MICAIGSVQRQLNVHGNVLEIGVHHGRLFILLYLLSGLGESAVAVDLFGMQELNIDKSGGGNLKAFLANMRRHADVDRLIVHEGDSNKLTGAELRRIGGDAFRLISIDGGHTRETTMHDLAIAEDALAEGGVIILDDFFSEFFPEVAEGTFRYFSERERPVVPFAIGGNKVMFCAKPWADRYSRTLSALSPKTAWRDFLGSRVLCLNFMPRSLAERIGETSGWRAIKDIWPMQFARRIYRDMLRPH